MADRILPWITTMDGDESVTLGPQEALRIMRIGTDKTASITPSIDGNQVGAIRSEIANIHLEENNEQGMLDLGDLYYYVPPETTISFDGAASDLVVMEGEWIDGPASRFEGLNDESRFNNQGRHHWTFTQGQSAISAAIADGSQSTIHTLTPNTDERYQFVGDMQIEPTTTGSYTEDEGDFGVLFRVDGQQWPSQFGDDLVAGIDYFYLQRPPQHDDDAQPFMWNRVSDRVTPLTLNGDQTLDVILRNISGEELASGGSNPTFTFTAAVIFEEGL